MHFYRSFRGLVFCPIEKRKTKADGGGIQKKDFRFDFKPHLFKTGLLSQTFQQAKIIVLKQGVIPVFVLIANRGLGGSPLYAQMVQVACGRTQTIANVTDRHTLGKLTEKHRD